MTVGVLPLSIRPTSSRAGHTWPPGKLLAIVPAIGGLRAVAYARRRLGSATRPAKVHLRYSRAGQARSIRRMRAG